MEETQQTNSDAEISYKNNEFTKSKIIEEAIRKCMQSRCNEMRDGYFNTRLDKGGNPIKTWMPDSRKVFISCVDNLISLMNPETQRDDTFKKYYKEDFDKKMQKVFNLFKYEARKLSKNDKGDVIWKKTGAEFMPKIDDKCVVRDADNPNTFIRIRGVWNDNVNQYYDEFLSIYDGMFEQLNNVLDRLKYFKSDDSE